MRLCFLIKTLITLVTFLGWVSCSSIQLKPGAERILVTRTKAPKGCKFLGTIVGSQGNFFTGGWTSNKNLAEGAMNDLKNKAASMVANYVQIESDRAGQTMSGSMFDGVGSVGGQQTDVTITGNAFRCPELD